MISIEIRLHSVEEVVDLVTKASKLSYDANFTNGRCYVDAKSILGVLSADFSEPCKIIIIADKKDEKIAEFIDSIKDKIVSIK